MRMSNNYPAIGSYLRSDISWEEWVKRLDYPGIPEDELERTWRAYCDGVTPPMPLPTYDELMAMKEHPHPKPRICMDFDGVIHSYKSGWTGDKPYDPPVENIELLLQGIIDMGYHIVILSTRKPAYIIDWLREHNLSHYFENVTNVKVPAVIYIDDRALKFDGNPLHTLHDILRYKTWMED